MNFHQLLVMKSKIDEIIEEMKEMSKYCFIEFLLLD